MPGIVIELSVTDNGTVKIKQFSDETKKAFDQMKKGPEDAKGPLAALKDSWLGVAAGATAAGYAFTRAYGAMKEIAAAGNEIEKTARTFNMSTENFQKWSYVARMADVDVQGLGMSLKFLTQSMGQALQGSGDAKNAFDALGIKLKDSTGKTKDQEMVLMETIDALGKYADGVNRDVLMAATFGRSWMSIKPLIDQGTKAIKEAKDESERLSLIIGKDVIRSLSESEDAFKRWDMTWKVSRMQTFEPLVNILGSMLERIMAIKRAWSEGGIKGVYGDILTAQEEARIGAMPAAGWVKEWVAGWTPPKIVKPEAPPNPDNPFGIEGFSLKKLKDEMRELSAQSAGAVFAGVPWGGEEALGLKPGEMQIEGMKILIADYEQLTAKIQEYNSQVATEYPIEKQMFEIEARSNELTISRTKSILDLREQIASLTGNQQELIAVNKAQEDFYIRTNNLLPEQIELYRKLGEVQRQQMTGASELFKDVGTQIANEWSSSLAQFLTGQKSFGDAMKSFWLDTAEYVIQQFLRMEAMELLFGNQKGNVVSGQGLIGGIGSVLGTVVSWFQEGAVFQQPSIIGVGEAGPEAVVPLKGGKIPIEGGQGQTIINHNYFGVTDAEGYRRMALQNKDLHQGMALAAFSQGKRLNLKEFRKA